MKTPPLIEGRALPSPRMRRERDRRFLLFVGMVLAAVSLSFKSELVGSTEVWGLGVGLLVLAVPALMGYLHTDAGMPSLEHFVPVTLGTLAVAGLSLLVPEWWKYSLIALAFGAGFCFAAQLDYQQMHRRQRSSHAVLQEIMLALALSSSFLVLLTLDLSLPIRLVGVFATSLLASYRSFRVLGRPMPERRALLLSVFVAQLLSFFFWAMSVYLYFTQGVFTVLLFLLWYVNRGIIRHTVEETLSRNVVIEYGLFVLLIAYLFFTSLQPR
ncbi:MAG TPA: hypothetical protein VKY90_03845 [Candidatus Dormibacteraeota bacterium]|nr:hypothetical protein [Candidatus Dormibacteraeota bacterium]